MFNKTPASLRLTLRALGRLIGRNRRRYGGYVVHAAIVLLAIGIAGSSAYDSAITAQLAPCIDKN